tara:strand:- start:52 stop:444 length:393 start_codon:yes stop_codon:yes gene_type:complete
MPGGSRVVKGVLDLLKDQYNGKLTPNMQRPTMEETLGGKGMSTRESVTPAVFDPMSSASDAISKDPTDDDVVKMIIADLKGNGLISEGASADEIFEYAESIASSKNESMSKVGNILMSPKAQMVYMDDDF